MPEPDPRITPGTVLKFSGGDYTVRLDDETVVEARLRGRLKLEVRTGDRVVAGDRVRVREQADGSVTIESVERRRSQLLRKAPGRTRRAKVIVANVDQVVVVLAVARPAPRLRMLDRLLVLAGASELPALVVVNKVDLEGAGAVLPLFAPYCAAGYDVLETSAATGAGVPELRDRLCGRESVLTGPSGAGKSSLLNAVEPGLGLRVGAISEAARKGRHTTVTAHLIPLQCGGFVADTPGLREVGLWGVDPDTLDSMFPEFHGLIGSCRFGRSCTHTHEPDCSVRAAVEEGAIDRGRYESYAGMRQDG